MNFMKMFGIVVGIHVFALILIFAIPGCSSTTKPAPAPVDTTAQAAASPTITVPNIISSASAAEVPPSSASSAPLGFNPDAPATYAGSTTSGGIRFTPTRPNTPAASAVLTQPVENVTPAATYKVKPGDSLWTIAKRNHLSVSDLASANNLRTTTVLHQGQMLIIPSKSPSPAAAAPAATSGTATTTAASAKSAETAGPAAGGEVKYMVKPGETLGMIARKFDVKASAIGTRNNIRDPQKLRAGTELIIPGWQTPTGKAARGSNGESTRSSSTSSATPSTQPTAVPNILDQPDQNQTPPPNNIPVIKIDETPSTPAPKS